MASPTLPVAIPRRDSRSESSIPGSSPPASCSKSPLSRGAAGASPPPSRSGGPSHSSGSKNWFKRLLYDPLLDAEEFTVGFVETKQQAERKSGAEAWSLRQHSHLVELPFAAFLARFGGGEDVPLHRIAFFKQAGSIVWESESLRTKLHDHLETHHSSHISSSRYGSYPASGYTSGQHSPFPGASPPSSSPGFSALSARMAQLHQQQRQQQLLSHSPGSGVAGLPPAAPLPPSAYIQFDPSPSSSDDGTAGSSGDDQEPPAADRHSPGDDRQLQGDTVAAATPAPTPAEPEVVPDFSDLPRECWQAVLGLLNVHELCTASCVAEWLRGMVAQPHVWRAQYKGLFGEEAPCEWNGATLRRMCRRSELRAARWLEAEVHETPCGFASTACLQLDDTKVVSGDGSAVRLWSHATGRRIATLPGHAGRVVSVAFDDEYIISGCTQGALKVWSMDELKCSRTLRTQHGTVAACALMAGTPVSAGKDGAIVLWDVGAGTPIVSLAAGHPVAALHVNAQTGHLVSAGWTIDVWDLNAASQLYSLACSTEPHGLPDPADSGAVHSFTSVSQAGNLLAAGKRGDVVLWDVRCQESIGSLLAPRSSPLPCIGVQLDDWKLVTGFASEDGSAGEHCLAVYDMRAACSRRGAAWAAPVQSFHANARMTCFQHHGESLLVGQEGAECLLWTFGRPSGSSNSMRGSSSCSPGDASGETACSSGGDRDRSGRKKKDKPAKVKKQQGRFPKRGTR